MATPTKSGDKAFSLLRNGFGWGTIFGLFVFSCVINILMLTGPLFMLQVYDRVLTSGSVPTLLALIIIVIALYAFYGLLEAVRSRVMARVGRRFEENMRGPVFDAMTFQAMRQAGQLGGQPSTDLALVRQFLSGPVPSAFFDMPWVPVYMLVVYFMHSWLGIGGFVAMATICVLAMVTEFATRRALRDSTAAQVKASIQTDEARRNTEAMHALGMRNIMRNRWSDTLQVSLDGQTRATDIGGIMSSCSRVVRLMVQSGILALGAYLAIRGEISSGTIVASSIILSRGLAPIEQAVGGWTQFSSARKAHERLKHLLRNSPKEKDRMSLPRPKGLLQVENVVFAVLSQEKPILAGLNFQLQPGQGLGVIGPTGAGKSTLAKILTGILPATRGTVRMDGAAIDQRSQDEYGRLIGYLPQDVQLFDGTVAENIARFDAQARSDDIVTAAGLAGVDDLIRRLPAGYDTPLGENGARLSAGQRQRVALARALYGSPVLLIMDEPNSNLDAEGEAALDRAIRATLARGACVVVVAHRPSALQAISHVLVLNEGKQAAFGLRDEVMKQVTRPQASAQRPGVLSTQANLKVEGTRKDGPPTQTT